jgi:RNA polymerase sigma factor (sigma-70 family)
MSPDALLSPIAALTDHTILSAEEEAALIATLRAGVATQAAIGDMSPASPEALRQIALGEEARATLARHNIRLVVGIAKRYLASTSPAFTLDDLISLGCVGLLRGIDKFDPAKSGRLSTYATWWIRQAISRGIAEEGRLIDLPVHMHERLSHYRRERAQLAQRLGRDPSPEELAAHLGCQPQRIAQLEQIGREILSLNAQIFNDDDRTELGDIVPCPGLDPEEAALESALRRDVAAAMTRRLSERERRFLRAYFGFDSGEKVTLEAIGAAEGLTRERVRQVIAEAVAKLRADPLLRSYAEDGAATF